MSREVALAIGVASARTLPYLAGAINGARIFHQWASSLGYESSLLTDESEDLTVSRLRNELESLLDPSKMPIHRMILYFAGHGLIREAEEALWLMSDWREEQRAVAVEVLKRRLFAHNIQQISIIADSCRTLPNSMLTADLTPDGVLGLGPVQPPNNPPIDRFTAAQDGAAAFMVPGENPDEDRCLFSGVLMEGLWGMKDGAFSKLIKEKVTSRSLAAFLQAEVPQRATFYKQTLRPIVIPSFPEDDDIYFYPGSGNPPARPAFSPWPSPTATAETEERAEEVAEDIANVRSLRDDRRFSDAVREVSHSELVTKMRSQDRPVAFETHAGFVVDSPVRAIWTAQGVEAERHPTPNWWRLNSLANPRLTTSSPVLIEFENDLFAAAVALPEFIGTLTLDDRGVSALIYRRVHSERNTAAAAEWAVGQMESDALRADAVTDLATQLRQDKHSDPVLGVISAYLYDSIGDIDNIRRMAFFYADFPQSIPYDLALLADLPVEVHDGVLRAYVPAVARREPRTEAERMNYWTYSATPQRQGEIGGFWPWMRQGWGFLDDSSGETSALITPHLAEVKRHLTSARFTTVKREGAIQLASIFNLTRRQ